MLKGLNGLKLDFRENHFWLKVCRSPDDSFKYENRNQYEFTRKEMMKSSSFNQTFTAHFNHDKMIIYIWRLDKRLPT